VDGAFTGSVHSNSVVTVGKTGLLEGEIVSKRLVVTGRFLGNADCDEIDILCGGCVVGHLSSKALTVERGSSFEGDSQLKDADVSPRDTNRHEVEATQASVAPMPSIDTLGRDSESKNAGENPENTDLCDEEAELVRAAPGPSADSSKNAWTV
jgi:hypothetical protein